jgi:hypothetical protein
LQISDCDETEMEVAEWEHFANVLTAFGFAKCFSKEKQIILPNLKIYLSYYQIMQIFANSEFVPKNINVFSTVSLLSAESSRIAIETKFDFSVSLSDEERYILRFGKIICFSFEKHLANVFQKIH